MRVLVAVKRAVDYAVKVRVKPDKLGMVLDNNVKMSINPFCEIATEAAVQLKEQKIATELIAVSIGPKQSAETLKTALALGCDKAVHVTTDMNTDLDLQPLIVSKALAAVVEKYKPDLVIVGKQSIDGDYGQTGQLLAGHLDWSQFTQANNIVISEDKKDITVTREIDGGLRTITGALPAVVTTDLRLNQPRYVTLPNIMKARKKPVDTLSLAELGIDLTPRLSVVSVESPPERKGGIIVESVEELVNKLQNEAKVL